MLIGDKVTVFLGFFSLYSDTKAKDFNVLADLPDRDGKSDSMSAYSHKESCSSIY